MTRRSQLLPLPQRALNQESFPPTASAPRATTAPAPSAASASSPVSTFSGGALRSPKPGTPYAAAPLFHCALPCARTALNAGLRSESLIKPRSWRSLSTGAPLQLGPVLPHGSLVQSGRSSLLSTLPTPLRPRSRAAARSMTPTPDLFNCSLLRPPHGSLHPRHAPPVSRIPPPPASTRRPDPDTSRPPLSPTCNGYGPLPRALPKRRQFSPRSSLTTKTLSGHSPAPGGGPGHRASAAPPPTRPGQVRNAHAALDTSAS